jgi:predicted metalloprotease with PDZ domain
VKSKLALFLLATTAIPAYAQQPQPLPYPTPIPTPQDTTWPGSIALSVDIGDVARHIVHVHETVPVQKAGDLVLLYPEWVPGDHGPTGPLADVADLIVKSGDHTLDWVRDTVNVHAFHIPVPQGAHSIDVSFEYLSPASTKEGRVEITPEMIDLSWNTVVLYPAGVFSRGITFVPTLTYAPAWHYATALETAKASPGHVEFKPTTLNTLVDSPLYAGLYGRRINLTPGAKVPVHLNIFADRPEDLLASGDQVAKHRALVEQAVKLFGAQHYTHYDFLFALSDELGGVGLEHHQSSEDGVDRGYFTEWDDKTADRDLLPHEYTHSWNGKFRRPADLWTPEFNVPMRDSLLWVYEGQTQFWGQILAARSGLWSRQEALDAIAVDADLMQTEIGREWRPLQDTTNDPIINERRPQSWHSWERQEDYYTEGLLIWLDADTLIRQKTNNQKSLNDFAHAFFGMNDGSYVTLPYTFDDVVKTLNAVLPYDWATFLRTRLDRKGDGAPLDGITRGGYKLVYTDTPSAYQKSEDGKRKFHDFSDSIGLNLGGDGNIISGIIWNSPAWKAGLMKGGKIIAIDGLAFDGGDDLSSAIKTAQRLETPIEILLQYGNHFRTVQVLYTGGLRYPHLERIAGTPALLDDILTPLK